MRLPSAKSHCEIRLAMLFHAGPSQTPLCLHSFFLLQNCDVISPAYSLAWSGLGLNYMLELCQEITSPHLPHSPEVLRVSGIPHRGDTFQPGNESFISLAQRASFLR